MTSKRLLNTTIIASGKGGVGKTWLSINLAHALGKRNRRVLLFDGDLGLANVDVQLGLKPQWDLGGVLKKKCAFEDAILSYRPDRHVQTPVDIITGRATDDAFMVVSKADLSVLRGALAVVAPRYNHMILDLSAGLDQMIQEFSTFAQQCLVVVTNDPASLRDALAFVRVTNQRNPDLPLHIVVNMVDSEAQGRKIYGTLANACHHFINKVPSLAGVIHRDRRVPESILKKIPLSSSHPASQTTQDVEKIAAELMGLKEARAKG